MGVADSFLGLFLIIIPFIVGKVLRKYELFFNDDEIGIILGVLTTVLGFFSIIFGFITLFSGIKQVIFISVAPKIYLIEYFIEAVK